ncbi:MAG: 2-oxo acid dehydrogenase subunit E2 [Thermoguttaceae bacterium]|nr:2-oxo acid dehydrogenase subunit E2 [Thermoguttaceae bacterium]MDW8039691.1 2-oxo acid dehydrogenase subunit E2 [Thermoguttaceae bacterium]
MAIDFLLPELGENIESADVVNVLVAEGDQIHANQSVVELETDKAVVEIPCPHAGRVAKVHVSKGQKIKVGQKLITVEPIGQSAAPPTAAPSAPAAVAVAGPAISPSAAPAKPSAPVVPAPARPSAPAVPAPAGPSAPAVPAPAGPSAPAVPAPTMPSASAVSAPAPLTSVPVSPSAQVSPAPGAVCPVTGAVLSGLKPPAPEPAGWQEAAPQAASASIVPELIPAGPAARRLARELGVDLRTVQGTGPRGRIRPEDVQAAAARQIAPGAVPVAPPTVPPPTPSAKTPIAPELAQPWQPVVPPGTPDKDAWGPIRREPMPRIRRTIAAQMVRSVSTIPHVTNFDDADITELEALRKSIPQGFLGPEVRLTLMPFLMKAVALTLRRHPAMNASLDMTPDNEQIIYKEYVNIGVAVDTPRGLVVPVVRNVDRMTIPEIARAVAEVAQRARTAQFTIEETRGGTFTISNLGAVGGTYSTPIINFPEVALLLVGRSRWMPVVRGEQIEKRLMLPLSLSYDHRLVDGATAARFLNEVIDWLQNPGKLLLMG